MIASLQGILSKIESRQNEIRAEVPTLLESSFQAFEDGNYGQAKSGLQFVFNSGVALDLDQQARLNRYLEKIYNLEAVRGEFNSSTVTLGTLQSSAQDQDPEEGEEEEAEFQDYDNGSDSD